MALRMAKVPEDNEIVVRYNQKVHQILKFMDERLGSVPWLAGEELTRKERPGYIT